MKELDLLVENYFTPALDATDILRLVEQVMNEAIDCDGTTEAMRFEWVVIATARDFAEASPVPKSLSDKSSEQKYICANTTWRFEDKGRTKLTPIGESARTTIEAAKASGFFTKTDFANASMEGVAKALPAGLGEDEKETPIEVKTDIMFGEKGISLKLGGDTQAATAEGKNTARALEAALESWLKSNTKGLIQKATTTATAKMIRDALAKQTELIAGVEGKGILSNSRTKQVHNQIVKMKKEIPNLKAKIGELEAEIKQQRPLEDDYEKLEKKLEKLKKKLEKTTKRLKKYKGDKAQLVKYGISDELGNLLIENKAFGGWMETIGAGIQEELDKLFNSTTQAYDIYGKPIGLSLKDALVDELLTGRGLFGEGHPGVAQYILNPKHAYTLVKGEKGYEDTIKTYSPAIRLRVDKKGGRPFTFGEEDGKPVISKTIGVNPAYRYDIIEKNLKHAVKNSVEDVFSSNDRFWSDVYSASSTIPPSSLVVEDAESDNIDLDLEAIMVDAMENPNLEAELQKLFMGAIDQDAMAKSLMNN